MTSVLSSNGTAWSFDQVRPWISTFQNCCWTCPFFLSIKLLQDKFSRLELRQVACSMSFVEVMLVSVFHFQVSLNDFLFILKLRFQVFRKNWKMAT